MNTIQILEQKAISAAKKESWDEAISVNNEILEKDAQNIGALNRIAMAHLRIGDTKQAQEFYNQVLELDKANAIAQKQLQNIKNNVVSFPKFSAQNFIEEPGIAKIIQLHRLAGKNVLEKLVVGQDLILKPKSRYISIETIEKIYIGSLPEDISARLTRLIETGNEYLCQVHNVSYNHCDVFVKETKRSSNNQNQHSFPVSYQADGNDLGDEIILDNDVPLSMVESDSDNERSLEDISAPQEDNDKI
ncbi:MAG: tetratricopeptide repeat protein [Pseudomonadales bacterium]|jgi:tetratricopeptide (TPR) repeat protein|nr:tetratricopeptide repeat protein [Pseudomonadales bacterium]